LRQILLVSTLLWLVTDCTPPPRPTQTAAPAITTDSSDFYCGKFKKGDTAKHVFQIRNSGNAPLYIKEVRTSCGCTIVDWSRDTIAPGGLAAISARLLSKDTGLLRKSIVMEANTIPAYTVLHISASYQ
jgi:Protein of unknown function (DUF1573)